MHSFSNSPEAVPEKAFPLDEPHIHEALRAFILQKNYPCVAAVRALHQNEIRVGVFHDFGIGHSSAALRERLATFLQQQRALNSTYLTYFAIFDGETDFSEEEFERRLWRELSCLTSEEQKIADWGAHVSDPLDEKFSFCLFGEPFFVVGLHPQSSRRGRRFSRPALVFNVFRQFQALAEKNAYEPMVRTNRRRDLQFDGSVNPMAEKFGEKWESIQFSGKKNSSAWKCPFRFLHKKNGE